MNKLFPVTTILLLVLSCACTRSDGDYKLPGVYRIDIQQGNVINQDMIDKLKAGMEKHQVRFIMGTPAIIDPFHPDRWEYIYTYTQGATQRRQMHLTLYFEDEKLAYLDGDVVTSLRTPPESVKRSKTVDVPLRDGKRPGLLGTLLEKVPFVGDDKPAPAAIDNDTTATDQTQPESTPATPEPQTETEEPVQADADEQPRKKGFFSRLVDKLPFVGNDEEDEQAVADIQE